MSVARAARRAPQTSSAARPRHLHRRAAGPVPRRAARPAADRRADRRLLHRVRAAPRTAPAPL